MQPTNIDQFNQQLITDAHAALASAADLAEYVVELDSLDASDGLGRLESDPQIWFTLWTRAAYALNLVDTIVQNVPDRLVLLDHFMPGIRRLIASITDLDSNSGGSVWASPTDPDIPLLQSTWDTVVTFCIEHDIPKY